MTRKRRTFSASFKAKVALEAVRETKTIAEIAQKHQLHPTQINLWKKQLLESAEDVFQDGRSKEAKAVSDEPDATELYEQIGRLKMQLEWLKKSLRERLVRQSLGSITNALRLAFGSSVAYWASNAAGFTMNRNQRRRRTCESCV